MKNGLESLTDISKTIRPTDSRAYFAAERHWDGIGKPLKGLGELERLIQKIAGILGTHKLTPGRKEILAFCADNGVVEEGVTQTDSSVTRIVAGNMAAGTASVCLMAKAAGAEVIPVDMGMNTPVEHPHMRQCAVAGGTKNFAKEPAMTKEQCLKALWTGIKLAEERKEAGTWLCGAGEMGIGNTTTSAALAAALLRVPPEEICGRGAGLSDEGLGKKRAVIRRAIEAYDLWNQDPLTVLAAVGGFDLAGIAGFYIGCAAYHLPVVMDGAISLTAGLCACEIEKQLTGRTESYIQEYLLPSHQGREPVCHRICERMSLHPVIHADLALGEGTGAALLFPLIDQAMAVYLENKTFADIHVEAYRDYAADHH